MCDFFGLIKLGVCVVKSRFFLSQMICFGIFFSVKHVHVVLMLAKIGDAGHALSSFLILVDSSVPLGD